MAQHCHGEHEVMMVLVGVLGLQPCQAAGQAQPHRSRWAFLLSLLNRQLFCPLTMDGPSFSSLSLSPQYFVLGITIVGLPCSKKNRVTPSSMSCQQPPPRPSIKSHEQIFKPLPSVLLLIASVKKYYFPNCIRGREKICIPKDQSSCTRQPGSTAHSLKMMSLLCSNGSICLSCLLTG